MTGRPSAASQGLDEHLSRPPYVAAPDFEAKYRAQCFCGRVQWSIGQDALSSMYCHCETCQTLHGTPYQWAAVVPKESVHFTAGIDALCYYSSGERAARYTLPCKLSCGDCRAPIADEGRNMMLLMPTYIAFPRDHNGRKLVPQPWKPQHHMFYGRRVADMKDGLEKYVTKKGEGKCDDEGRVIEDEQGAKGEK
ncbi:protein of unknown function [Taphrina deformans PYCC 5710]|uniref:CENP-V/GFA domain-containing protein n=1 Tax=Taphrina deformans (strain PYCC 5710 / ATCC 11124 / CBS 356.35 / IMI 108563 / JCM 9778 / NBRC 8474) TaxID=1097556 RepID=R4XI40_TAPDE|nr:protein of unknown function [Taphrina deformans PYCC 5710]|eukprot:CCG84139.1 protein of unknown function [Taphrina deformans PYCC 5710]